MTEKPILIETHGHVRWITLNRPEVMNAITPQMLTQLNDELKAADDAPTFVQIRLANPARARTIAPLEHCMPSVKLTRWSARDARPPLYFLPV